MVAESELYQIAKSIRKYVETEYKLPVTVTINKVKWNVTDAAYLMASYISNPKNNVAGKHVGGASGPTGDRVNRDVNKAHYVKMCKELVSFVDKKGQLPNYITVDGKQRCSIILLIYCLSKIIVWMHEHKNAYPNYCHFDSRAFTKNNSAPVATSVDEVYDYAVKKFGIKFTTLDDVLEYVLKYFSYEFYYDDYKSNKQVTDSKSGNCVDLLQWLWHMAKAMGYDCRCIHVQCQSGVGHVYGQFKHAKNTGGKWITRDIAAVADGNSITHVWCSNGYVLAQNPSWFTMNLNR